MAASWEIRERNGWAEKTWANDMPPGAKEFFLTNAVYPDLDGLLEWWRACVEEWRRTGRCKEKRWMNPFRSWLLALHYVQRGEIITAMNLLINGAFLQYVDENEEGRMVASIELALRRIAAKLAVAEERNPQHVADGRRGLIYEAAMEDIPQFHSLYQLKVSPDPDMLMHHLQGLLTKGERDWREIRDEDTANEFVHWCLSSTTVAFLDEGKREVCELTIGRSTKLKVLFNTYAEDKGVSLRALRFSYKDSTLFLSSVGNKTPEDMGMKDRALITVINTARLGEGRSDDESSERAVVKEKPKKQMSKKKSRKLGGKKTKSKAKHQSARAIIPSLTEEQLTEKYWQEHSISMTTVLEELEPTLKKLRTDLNNLTLQKTAPKARVGKKKSKRQSELKFRLSLLADDHIGGKAGRTIYPVLVGEASNLYKTNKSVAMAPIVIDLHGCTQEEAIASLNESLPAWIDVAMRGRDPWVIPVDIVCGGGHQILSGAVQEWIRSNRRVANRPKGR